MKVKILKVGGDEYSLDFLGLNYEIENSDFVSFKDKIRSAQYNLIVLFSDNEEELTSLKDLKADIRKFPVILVSGKFYNLDKAGIQFWDFIYLTGFNDAEFLKRMQTVMKMKMSSQRVEMLEQQYKSLMDNSPDIIHSVGADFKIIFSNKKAAEILGYDETEFIGMDLKNFYSPKIHDLVYKGFEKLKVEGKAIGVKSTILAKDGHEINVEISSTAQYNTNGDFIGTISILRVL